MPTARDLYRVTSGALAPSVPRGLTLVSTLPGVIDAGQVCRVAATYLTDSLPHERLITFEADELIDFRSSRPLALFDGSRFALDSEPSLHIDLLHDEAGVPFLLMSGLEPDLRWYAMSDALVEICETFEIARHMSLRAVPAEVPHTRVISLVPHANAVAQPRSPEDAYRTAPLEVPASFAAFLDVRLEAAGLSSQGFVAQIPHYLSRTSFPAGALALLRRVGQAAGLSFGLMGLGDIVEASTRLISTEVAENRELEAHVRDLEEAYDAMQHGVGEDAHTVLDMPTADEIGDRLERFLAENTRDDGQP